MATTKLRKEIVGVTVELSREEVYALVNTAERLGDLLDLLETGHKVTGRNLVDTFLNEQQANKEAREFFKVSRSVAMMIDTEFTSSALKARS